MRLFYFFFLFLTEIITQNLSAQLLPTYGDSRTATTGWQFLKINPDAHASGVSESYIATVNDAGSVYWNPAGLTQLDTNKYHFIISHTDYVAGTNQEFAAIIYRTGDNTLIGASVQYFNAGEMNVTTEFMPQGTGQTFRATDMGIGITLARELTDQFSFGITAKYVREDIATVHNQNIVFDFGFQYDIGIANTRFAVGLQSFGFNTSPSGEIAAENLYDSVIITDFTEIAVPTVFRLGFAWDAIRNEKNILTTSAQLNHPTDNNETYSIGIEYGWKKIFFARTGYTFSTDFPSYPSIGFGIQLKRYFGTVKLDYGFNYQNTLGTINRIGLGFTL
ncbi:MAG: PorV/PorQ family protein [Fimbriimonadaceae bacterium]|nr:PorV/PorQ family protein [Chitinophagales bacterium]